jgi:hypothetical protein
MRWGVTQIGYNLHEVGILFDDFIDEFGDEVVGDLIFIFFYLIELIIGLFFLSKSFHLLDD